MSILLNLLSVVLAISVISQTGLASSLKTSKMEVNLFTQRSNIPYKIQSPTPLILTREHQERTAPQCQISTIAIPPVPPALLNCRINAWGEPEVSLKALATFIIDVMTITPSSRPNLSLMRDFLQPYLAQQISGYNPLVGEVLLDPSVSLNVIVKFDRWELVKE